MNAAAKVINQTNVFYGEFSKMRLSVTTCTYLGMLLAILISAISVIDVTNMQRVTLSQLQLMEQKNHQLQVQWGQLLLEQASLATPARVEKMAAEKLCMVLPAKDHTFVVRAH
jgi:cell division protein FtsL